MIEDTTTLPSEINEQLEKVLVGGAVRDMIMGLEPKDRDWLVMNQTPASMLEMGFIRVGRSSRAPVFLHPKDILREEYALPRIEISTGPGTNEFEYKTLGVTVMDDLARRDITINAMAMHMDGTIIDEHGGQLDIKSRTIRAVNPVAFEEDPLRVMRVARFAARMSFTVDNLTTALCENMVALGKLSHLSSERIYGEIKKALVECHSPSTFFRHLKQFGLLKQIAPELERLVGVEQVQFHHGEGDAFNHSLLVLNQARKITKDHRILMAALCHDLGKAETPPEEYPKHHDHESKGIGGFYDLAFRLGLESKTITYCIKVMSLHMKFHRILDMKSGSVKKLLDNLNARHSDELVMVLAIVGQADALGRIPQDIQTKSKVEFLFNAAKAYRSIRMQVDNDKSLFVRKQMMTGDRVRAIKRVRSRYVNIREVPND